MLQVKHLIRQFASSLLPVLIRGETGTGKELVARAIHCESNREKGPFVSLNCAAVPHELLEAELFGYIRGAFSGAETDNPGLLSSARGGTFFFDDIGEMPLSLQGKLLRLLDSRRFRPLGGAGEIEADVRFLFASNRDLNELVAGGKFRSDLFYRLGVLEIVLPPLRERLEDLPDLVNHFRSSAGGEGTTPFFQESALGALATHLWPGNVRELKTVITRLSITSADTITANNVRALLDNAPARGLFSPALLRTWPLAKLHEQLEREYLIQLHEHHGGDRKAMASALGITTQALYKRLKTLGIRRRKIQSIPPRNPRAE